MTLSYENEVGKESVILFNLRRVTIII